MMNLKIVHNVAPYHAALEHNKRTGDFKYRWCNALTGEITLDKSEHRILCWPCGTYIEIDGLLYLAKFAGKSSDKPFMDSIEDKRYVYPYQSKYPRNPAENPILGKF